MKDFLWNGESKIKKPIKTKNVIKLRICDEIWDFVHLKTGCAGSMVIVPPLLQQADSSDLEMGDTKAEGNLQWKDGIGTFSNENGYGLFMPTICHKNNEEINPH